MRFAQFLALRTPALLLHLLATATVGCSNDAASNSGEDCDLGSEGCHCYGNKTCNDDLSCLSNRCVNTSPENDNDNDDAAASVTPAHPAKDASVDDPTHGGGADASIDEPAQTGDSTDESSGNSEPSPTSSEATTEPQTEPHAGPDAATPPDQSGTMSVTDPSAPDSSGECTPSGNCVDGDAMDCVNGKRVARDCTGCAVLACTCCGNVGTFGMLDTTPFDELPEVISEFTQDPEYVSIDVNFDSRPEAAMLVFNLDSDYTFDYRDLRVDLTYSGLLEYLRVSFEHNGSDSGTGCMYDLELDAGTVYKAGSWVTCWGDYAGLDAPPLVRTVTVRIGTYGTSGAAQLTVRELRFVP